MFQQKSETGYTIMAAGIERRTLVYGQKTLMAEFRLKKGSVLPRHAHPHEQTGYLVQGRLRFTVGEETRDVQAGDSWCIAGGVAHSVEVADDALVIEVFSPVREDFLP